MIRRTFSCHCPVGTKLKLYTSLIRSQLQYGSQLWRPMHAKDIHKLEQMQRRATKFILNNVSSNYKSRLLALWLLPLMMLYELNDVMFFINNVKSPSQSFDILNGVTFSSSNTRSCSGKLVHRSSSTNSQRHFYFTRLVKLWNALPVLDMSLSSLTLRAKIKDFLWSAFVDKFNPSDSCTFHFICPCAKCSAIPKPSNYRTLWITTSFFFFFFV